MGTMHSTRPGSQPASQLCSSITPAVGERGHIHAVKGKFGTPSDLSFPMLSSASIPNFSPRIISTSLGALAVTFLYSSTYPQSAHSTVQSKSANTVRRN